MKGQMQSMGFGYDWDREVTTCTPDYYQWNQWLFRRFHEAGLVERRDAEVNWCPSCETVLADEQVEGDDELCWRCDTPVETRDLDQWFLEITEYADELLEAIDGLAGWPDSVRQMQRNWIGRQHGTTLDFEVSEARSASNGRGEGTDPREYGPVEAFTTRVDTIHGATFFALAPDHPISEELAESDADVRHFIEEEADPEGDEPNGVATGLTATNPVTSEEIPVFVADFVLSDVGTGALMAVPGHDDRDHAFAEKMGVEIKPVIAPKPEDWDGETIPDAPDVSEGAFTDDGVVIDSGEYSGLDSETARERLTEDIESAETTTQYRLRDWGSPDSATGDPDPGRPLRRLRLGAGAGSGPAGRAAGVHQHDREPARRRRGVEGDDLSGVRRARHPRDRHDGHVRRLLVVLPALRLARRRGRTLRPGPRERLDAGRPVRRRHRTRRDAPAVLAVRHQGVSRRGGGLAHREPFTNLLAQGMVQLEGEKMSKSKGNTVSPQRIVDEYGADTARLFMMQAAQPERDFDWAEEGVKSTHRFLARLTDLVEEYAAGRRRPRARTPTATRSTITSPTRSTPRSPSRARSTTT